MIQETRHAIDEILSRQPLFRGLSEEELQVLASGAREYRVSRNEILFNKGDTPTGIHVVVMGQIKLFLPAQNGWEKVIHMEGPGSSFGEAVVFLDKPYPVSAQATQDSIVLLVGKEAITRTLDDNPALGRKMLASLSLRLHELLTDIEACTLRTSAQRVICYLTQQAPADANRFEVALGTSKQTVASQLNLAPETFSRVLSHLVGAGLITVEGRRITVLDAERLRSFSG
ncbi:MAG: Crp/Fnr family transcriptional regulator [Thiobacillaceae bacterium]|jgi:CRP-like cAMP-binding protein|nr:Crp/Fnr family transcriptional regulator [Thiobacillaceae bacterium]